MAAAECNQASRCRSNQELLPCHFLAGLSARVLFSSFPRLFTFWQVAPCIITAYLCIPGFLIQRYKIRAAPHASLPGNFSFRKMISVRIRSLATTYARDCVRSATAAGGSGYKGGGVRVSTAVAARAFSSTLPSAQPPLPSNLDATGDQAHAEEGLDASHPGQELHRNEKAEGVVELLQRHAQAVRTEEIHGKSGG